MRVAKWYSNRDVRMEEVPAPRIGPGELLVRVESSGICGSDVMEWYRRDKAPLVLGHEIGGEIITVGEGVKRYKVGERVSAAHHVPCFKCRYCLSGHHTMCDTLRKTNFDPGGFAEYIRLPAINVEHGVFPLPDEMSFEEATFIEPLACVLRAQRTARMQTGQSVVVIGSGISGLLHIQLARIQGASLVLATDVVDYRLAAARKFGANEAIHSGEYTPERLRQANQGRLADLVIICSGATAAVNQAMQSVERGGTVLFFAPASPGVTIPTPINDLFWRTDITLTTSYGAAPSDYAAALELISSHRFRVREMVTHKLPLAETGTGFQLVSQAQNSIKVIVEPQK